MLRQTIRSGLTKVGDIGDMDSNSKRSVVVLLDGQRIIQILSSRRINGEDALFPQIFADFVLSFRDPSY